MTPRRHLLSALRRLKTNMNPFLRDVLQSTDRRMRELLLQFAKGSSGLSLGTALKPFIGGDTPKYIYPSGAAAVGSRMYAASYDHVHPVYATPNWASSLGYAASGGSSPLYFALYDHVHRGLTIYDTQYGATYTGVHTLWNYGASSVSNGVALIGGAGGGGGQIDPSFTTPVDADFAWINQGSSTLTDDGVSLFLRAPAGSGSNIHIRKQAAPATPYTLTVAMRPTLYPASYSSCGVLFRESSSGKLHTFQTVFFDSSGIHLISAKFSNPTTYVADYKNLIAPIAGAYVWLRIQDDGTNRICSFSMDGRNFIVYHTIGRTDYLTADEIGFCCLSNNGSAGEAGITVYSWEVS